MKLKTIETIEEIRELIRTYPDRLYVRWSARPQADLKRGYSLNHATGSRERGLSCVRVTGRSRTQFSDPERQRAADEEALVRQLTAYSFLRFGLPGVRPWLLTGELAGTDADGCPVVVNARPLGRLAPALVEQLLARKRELIEAEIAGVARR